MFDGLILTIQEIVMFFCLMLYYFLLSVNAVEEYIYIFSAHPTFMLKEILEKCTTKCLVADLTIAFAVDCRM